MSLYYIVCKSNDGDLYFQVFERGWHSITTYFKSPNENKYNSFKATTMSSVAAASCNKNNTWPWYNVRCINTLSERDQWFWYTEVCLMLISLWNTLFHIIIMWAIYIKVKWYIMDNIIVLIMYNAFLG